MVILSEATPTQARALADKLRQAIEDTQFTTVGERLPLTISIEVAPALMEDQVAQAILDRADQAMYRAKEAGRNLVMIHEPPA